MWDDKGIFRKGGLVKYATLACVVSDVWLSRHMEVDRIKRAGDW